MKKFLFILMLVLLVGCTVQRPIQPQPIQRPQPMQTQPASQQKAPQAQQKTIDVAIQDFSFKSSTVTINSGDSIRWTNKDSASHTATGQGFDTGTLSNGQSKTIVFNEPGAYQYTCSFHPGMRGTIVVQ